MIGIIKVNDQLPSKATIGWLLEPVSGNIVGDHGYMVYYEYPSGHRCDVLRISRKRAQSLAEELLALGYIGMGKWDTYMVYTPRTDNP